MLVNVTELGGGQAVVTTYERDPNGALRNGRAVRCTLAQVPELLAAASSLAAWLGRQGGVPGNVPESGEFRMGELKRLNPVAKAGVRLEADLGRDLGDGRLVPPSETRRADGDCPSGVQRIAGEGVPPLRAAATGPKPVE